MEDVGEGSSGRCCPNAEDPSKMHSRDGTYGIQEGRKDGVSERSKYRKGKSRTETVNPSRSDRERESENEREDEQKRVGGC